MIRIYILKRVKIKQNFQKNIEILCGEIKCNEEEYLKNILFLNDTSDINFPVFNISIIKKINFIYTSTNIISKRSSCVSNTVLDSREEHQYRIGNRGCFVGKN